MTHTDTMTPENELKAAVTAAIEAARAEGHAEGLAKGASYDEAKKKLNELRKTLSAGGFLKLSRQLLSIRRFN